MLRNRSCLLNESTGTKNACFGKFNLGMLAEKLGLHITTRHVPFV